MNKEKVIWVDQNGYDLRNGDSVVEIDQHGNGVGELKYIRKPPIAPIVHKDGSKEYTHLEGITKEGVARVVPTKNVQKA